MGLSQARNGRRAGRKWQVLKRPEKIGSILFVELLEQQRLDGKVRRLHKRCTRGYRWIGAILGQQRPQLRQLLGELIDLRL